MAAADFRSNWLYSPDNNIIKGEVTHTAYNPENITKLTHVAGDWFLGTIIFSLIILAWVKNYFNKYLFQVVEGNINFQVSQRLYKDKNALLQRVTVSLNLIFIIISSGYIYLIIRIKDISPLGITGFKLYVIIAVLLFLFVTLKFIGTKIIAYIFQKQKEFSEYLHNVVLSYENIGLFLLPLVVSLAYISLPWQNVFIYMGLFFIGIIYVSSYFRALQILRHRKFYVMYLLLYFLLFEILPVLLFVKAVNIFVL